MNRMPYYTVAGLPKGNFMTCPERPIKAEVECLVRSLMNTPGGPAFLHLYRNNLDDKEHVALVFDRAQLDTSNTEGIRSASLDSIWSSKETDMERLVRGAHSGRLTPQNMTPSPVNHKADYDIPALVRVHSQCYTGENLLNDRCDCRQQMDDAIRVLGASNASSDQSMRGVLVYLMQEGRGIGLLSKLRAYNIQDCGHTDDEANVMLGHKEDERSYAVAAAILRDLGVAESVHLLTANPDKVAGVRQEGVNVTKVVSF